jgi:hypothetical protein
MRKVALLVPGGQGGIICDECVDAATQLVESDAPTRPFHHYFARSGPTKEAIDGR